MTGRTFQQPFGL